MSKMDGLRAMREARYAARTAPGAPAPKPKRATPPRADDRAPVAPVESPAPGLCGHRAISGRTCTREHGHAAKSHRYA